MSQENIEIVRRALIEFNRSHRLTDAWAPDFVWEPGTYPGAPTTVYHGREGFYEFLEEWTSPYGDWQQELDGVSDVEGDQVVAVMNQRGRLSGTENWVEVRYAALYTLDGGLIRRARVYPTSADALKAAGLTE